MPPKTTKTILNGIAIFIFFSVGYNIFISRQVFSEGSTWCLPVWRKNSIFFDAWHHILYPAGIYLWYKVTVLLNMAPKSPLDFIINTARMNAFAASLSLALFFGILQRLAKSRAVAFAGTAALGFSNIFLFDATNSSEPMLGHLFSMLSFLLIILAADRKKAFFIFLSAFFLSLATLFFLPVVTIAPGILAYIVLFFKTDSKKDALRSCFIYIILTVLCIPLIILPFMFLSVNISDIISLPWSQAISPFIFFAPKKILKLLLGLVGLVLYGVQGWKEAYYEMLSKGTFGRPLVQMTLLSPLVIAVLTYIFFIFWKIWDRIEIRARRIFYVIMIMLVSSLAAPFLHDPFHDKLWLQPISFLIIISCLAIKLHNTSDTSNKKFANIFMSLFVGSFILYNIVTVLIPNHFGEIKYLKEAEEVNETVGAEDLLIGSWNNLSCLLSALFEKSNLVTIEDEMFSVGLDKKAFFNKLSNKINAARRNNGKVYFLGVLEQHRSRWDAFLYNRLGLPYDSFNEYRINSRLIKNYSFKTETRDLALYEYR